MSRSDDERVADILGAAELADVTCGGHLWRARTLDHVGYLVAVAVTRRPQPNAEK